MYKLIICCLLIAISLPLAATAQVNFTFRELFKQKKTEIKYLTQQVAELQLYLNAVKRGYNIVQSGLHTVEAVKNGEFHLHELFYAGQLRVNPIIRSMPDAISAITNSRRIHQQTNIFLRQLKNDEQLPAARKQFIERTCQKLIKDVDTNMSDLETLLTSGALQMDDHQRIACVQQVLQRSLQQLHFSNTFFTDARLISRSHLSDQINLQGLRNRYHLQTSQP